MAYRMEKDWIYRADLDDKLDIEDMIDDGWEPQLFKDLYWRDDMRCVCLMMDGGWRCGYVRVPRWSHLWDDEKACREGYWPHDAISFRYASYPATERGGATWLGFDCNHSWNSPDVQEMGIKAVETHMMLRSHSFPGFKRGDVERHVWDPKTTDLSWPLGSVEQSLANDRGYGMAESVNGIVCMCHELARDILRQSITKARGI